MDFVNSHVGDIEFTFLIIQVVMSVVIAGALVSIATSLKNKRKEN